MTTTTNPSLPAFSSFITVKLSTYNFLLWKAQVTPYLRAQKLFSYVNGTKPCPPSPKEGEDGATYEEWIHKDQLVLSILTSSLTKSVLVQVIDCTTSKDAWDLLTELFASKSTAQVVQSRLQLASLKKGAEPISEYFNKAKSLVSSITTARQVISDTEFMVTQAISDTKFMVSLLAGLGSENDSIVTTLSAQTSLPTPSQVLSHLLVHESCLAHQSSSNITVPPIWRLKINWNDKSIWKPAINFF